MAGCVRTAWLDLYGDGTVTMPLENPAGGWFCSSLDLGYPASREVTANRPDQDGVDDRTRYMGGRVVSANISALAGAGARIDDVADNFGPYMIPSARPVLHYVLDRPGAAERTLTLRGSGYAWAVAGAYQRDIQLQWLAADPVARDPATHVVTAWMGSPGAAGRTYPLTFNRAYPPAGGAPITGIISSPGDIAVRPLLRIYGPVTAPDIRLVPSVGPAYDVRFVAGFTVAGGDWVDVDTANKTAYIRGDPTRNAVTSIDWVNTTWPVLPVAPAQTTMNMTGSGASSVTQVQAIWNDGYLT
jgi:hypothetical protein